MLVSGDHSSDGCEEHSGVARTLTSHVLISVVVALVLLVMVALLAVTLGSGLPDDGDPIEVTPAAALSFVAKSSAAAERLNDGKTADVWVTEEEVTSFFVLWSVLSRDPSLTQHPGWGITAGGESAAAAEFWDSLSTSATGYSSVLSQISGVLPGIRDPEVRFSADGDIVARGTARVGFLSVPTRAVVVPTASNGRMELGFRTGDVGRMPVPGPLFRLFGAALSRALSLGLDDARVTHVSVQQGRLHVVAGGG